MVRSLCRVAVLVVIGLLAVATSASAEAGWALWALDLNDLTVIKAERLLTYESWRECTYVLIAQTRNEMNIPNPTLPPGRKQPTAIFQCLPGTFVPNIGSLK
jgi:hypothetical protein